MWTILSSSTKNVEGEMEREKMKKRKGKRGSLECQSSSPFMCCVKKKNLELLRENRDGSKRLPKKEKEKLETNQKKPNVIRTCNNLKDNNLYIPTNPFYICGKMCVHSIPPFHPQTKQAFVRHLLLLRPKTREHTHFVFPPFFCSSYDQFPPSPPPPPLFRKFPLGTEGREGKRKR